MLFTFFFFSPHKDSTPFSPDQADTFIWIYNTSPSVNSNTNEVLLESQNSDSEAKINKSRSQSLYTDEKMTSGIASEITVNSSKITKMTEKSSDKISSNKVSADLSSKRSDEDNENSP